MRINFFLLCAFAFGTLFPQKPYRGAEYRTIQNYQYGRFEVRMKSALGPGVVSSFFTIRDYWSEGLSNTSNWREIDFEGLGNYTNKFQTNIITAYENHHEELITLQFNPHVTFHTYAFEWTPEYINFFIDGSLIRQDTNEYIASLNTGQKIMMNIWQPIWVEWVGSFDESILPVYALYDWVKYYTYTPENGSYGTNQSFTLSWEDDFDTFDQSRWQKATHTWSANNAQFVEQNAVIENGYLILCLTDNNTFGYSGDPLSVFNSNHPPINNPGVFIYPNPFNSSFTINIENINPENIKNIQLIDLKGNIVFSTSKHVVHDTMLKVELKNKKLPSGIYYGLIVTDDVKKHFKITYLQ